MTDFRNIDTSKSYATEVNLIKALTAKGFDKYYYVVVCNRQGRFTAIFSLSLSRIDGGDICIFAREGFKTFA